MTTRTSLGRKRPLLDDRSDPIEDHLAELGDGRRRFVVDLADTAYALNLAGVKGNLAGSWRGYGGGAHRQEKRSHFLHSSDLGGGVGKALLATARKN